MSSWQCLTFRDPACCNSTVVFGAGANLPLLLHSWTKINAVRISFLQSLGSRKTTGSTLDARMVLVAALFYTYRNRTKRTMGRPEWENLPSITPFPSGVAISAQLGAFLSSFRPLAHPWARGLASLHWWSVVITEHSQHIREENSVAFISP